MIPLSSQSFEQSFEQLAGFPPLAWQTRLYRSHFEPGRLPSVIDIPTGLGKTNVIVLWLIARASSAALPRRLIYVVDRRAVVDQATDVVVKLRSALDLPAGAAIKSALGLAGSLLPISTLRGQHIDNRQWLDDPAAPAIVVGTVDMVGSRLLFEGYGVSPKMRPYHAGLLGADALVVLDEAHLVPPFEHLLASIEGESDRFGATSANDRALLPAFKLLSLSATGRQRAGEVFKLEGDTTQPAGQRRDLDDRIVARRLAAKKSVRLFDVEGQDLADALAGQAWDLTDSGRLPLHCLVFSNSRDVAEKARDAIRKKRGISDKKQDEAGGDPTELLVGARRVREREDARSRLEALGFLAGKPVTRERPLFLFATSAGEVGIDLDADHIVCDRVEWERMVQRLGRVNRRGDGDAEVRVLLAEPTKSKSVQGALDKADDSRTDADRNALQKYAAEVAQLEAFRAVMQRLPGDAQAGYDASPGALRQLAIRAAADATLKRDIDAATSVAPLRPALTRPLVDAWAMTSLEEHTGRPDIEPWLRGWVSDEPQTTLVWRTHLPVRRRGTAASKREVEQFFEAAPAHASEGLETETYRVMDWLAKRCTSIVSGNAEHQGSDAQSAPLHRDDVLGFVLSKANKLRKVLHATDFSADAAKGDKKEIERELAGAVLIVDAGIGGLHAGLLSHEPGVPVTADAGDDWGSAADGEPLVRFRVRAGSEVERPADANWVERHRFATERDDEGHDVQWLFVDKWRGDSATERDRAIARNPQLLDEHQSWAEARARVLAKRLGLPKPWEDLLALSARLHDEGKRPERWQRAFSAERGAIYAKTRGPIDQQLLDGYRHEFGSLPYAEKDEAFQRLPDDLKDLVLHLIAAHHGQARLVIGTRGCDDAPPSELATRARDVALRFARLQQRWGPWGLAWWEALLRAADQQASRQNDERKAGD